MMFWFLFLKKGFRLLKLAIVDWIKSVRCSLKLLDFHQKRQYTISTLFYVYRLQKRLAFGGAQTSIAIDIDLISKFNFRRLFWQNLNFLYSLDFKLNFYRINYLTEMAKYFFCKMYKDRIICFKNIFFEWLLEKHD